MKKRSSRVSRPLSRVSKSADLLFEIGTEELPAAYLPSLIDQLGKEAAALFTAQHLAYQQIQSFGAPRRLVLVVRGLDPIQRKPGEEVRGPSTKAAFDPAGKPTQALEGFLRSQGGRLEQTKTVSGPKGDYIYLLKPPTTTPTLKVLETLLPQVLGKLRSPKAMRWDSTGVRFARPIRWLIALYGATPVKCAYGVLKSGTVTRIGQPLRTRTASVTSAEAYFQTLKKHRIIVDQNERGAFIEQQVNSVAKQAGGFTAPEMASHGLIGEVVHLTEEPVPLAASFDKKYLDLPREVLLASMAKYQRVFAIQKGKDLLPQCIAILESTPAKPAQVRAIIERILNARLADSYMFLNGDRARPLAEMARDLAGVTFHEKLGSMAVKAGRLTRLADTLATAWDLAPGEAQQLRRACELAKADLVSTMVKEFPTLQGVMGKYYARHSGEPEPVAAAIEEHYLPIGKKLPMTTLGCALAILDKYDTLSSYFGLGIMPTGDQDPFGLRRAAQGIVEVTWAAQKPFPLSGMLSARAADEPFASLPKDHAAKVGETIRRYILERLYTFDWPAPVPANDYIDAVLASPAADLLDAMKRIQTLQALSSHPGLRKAAKVIERTRNILKSATVKQQDVDTGRLAEAPERELWSAFESNHEQVRRLAESGDYSKATTLFGETFYEPLHTFFDKVLVNDPDEGKQQNRLALMKAIHTLYTERVADLSKLTLLQQQDKE